MFRDNLERSQLIRGLCLLALGAFFLFCFQASVDHFLPNDVIGLGRVLTPHPTYMAFGGLWTVLGGLAVLTAAWGCAELFESGASDSASPIPNVLRRGSDRVWLLAGTALAALFPALVRVFVLEGMPLTDDEHSYRFMARLIAGGDLYAESLPVPLKLFFDRAHLINDGQWYAQYFIGWPMLMVPGLLVGAVGWTNVVFSALTVAPLYDTLRRLADRTVARLGAILFVGSPFAMIAAGTLSSHVSTLFFLICTWWALARFRDAPGARRWSLLLAVFFSIAFFIRPLSALGLGGPALAIWGYRLFTSDRNTASKLAHLAYFVVPSGIFAAAFLGVNYVQNGSALKVAYMAMHEYAISNGYRFAGMTIDKEHAVPNLHFDSLRRQAFMLGAATFRMNLSAFGWPASLVLLVFAGWRKNTRWLWAALIGFVLAHAIANDPGVDYFGPVHFYELLWPIIGLTAFGLVRLSRWANALDEQEAIDGFSFRNAVWYGLVIAFIAMLIGYLPIRMGTLSAIADSVEIPHRAVETRVEGRAVVFSTKPFAKSCRTKPARPVVFWRPTNSPDFDDRIIWANHISVNDDRRLMAYFPDRTGWILFWTSKCKRTLVPLDQANPSKVPDGAIGGSGEPPDWSVAPEPYNIEQRR